MSDRHEDLHTGTDPREAARSAGLVYVSDEDPGVRREGAAPNFRFRAPDGKLVRDQASLERIRSLAIPPAWTGVWICARPNGHIQATGRDARGRKQYKYHPQFREVRETTKYEHMLEFARALPSVRARLAEHMALPGLPREKVLATVVHLLETTLIRIGNDDYARTNKSYGLTTLRNRHVKVDGTQLRFQFKGKSGRTWNLQLKDRRVARVIRACQELPGQELFAYQDAQGEVRRINSSDVNAYLRDITGGDVSAKDFRTWAGTVLAALTLRDMVNDGTPTTTRKNLRGAIAQVAARLGNTPTICRKCYVHPAVLAAYAEGSLALQIETDEESNPASRGSLRPEEAAVLQLLESRLHPQVTQALEQSLSAVRRTGRSRVAKAAPGASVH